MSTEDTSLYTAIQQLTAIIQLHFNRLVAAIVNNTKWISQLIVIGRKGLQNAAFFQLKGLKTKEDLSKAIDAMEPPAFSQTHLKAPKKGGGVMGALGTGIKGLLSSIPQLALLGVIMEPLTALIGAFLEPLEMITPLFEAWGAMLSQLLIPIVMAIMDIMMPMTPAIQSIIDMLVPLIPLVILIFKLLNPIIFLLPIIIDAIGMLATVLTIVTGFIGGLTAMISTFTDGMVSGIVNWLRGLWTIVSDWAGGIIPGITAWARDAVQAVKDAVANFFKGGFDGDPDTWY